jgi:hypothetical protein
VSHWVRAPECLQIVAPANASNLQAGLGTDAYAYIEMSGGNTNPSVLTTPALRLTQSQQLLFFCTLTPTPSLHRAYVFFVCWCRPRLVVQCCVIHHAHAPSSYIWSSSRHPFSRWIDPFNSHLAITPLTSFLLLYFFFHADHMYGSRIGSLQVKTCVGSTCTLKMTVTGQQQTAREKPWQAVTMIVPAATTTIQFIAFGQTGGSGSFNGDISIDSISLTNAPAGCSFGNPSDIFQVTATSMGLTCGVGGMPISAAKGACYTTSSARCFTDGPGNHGNSESCTIRATQSVRLAVAGSFSVHGSDGFRITGSSTLRNTPQELNNYPVTTARNITWTSTSTVTQAGYTICVSFVFCPHVPSGC